MNDDSDNTKKTEKRCKRPLKAASSSDSSDSGSPLAVTKRSRKQLAVESESDASPIKSSDNSSPIAPRLNRRRRVPVVPSDNESSSSEDEEIIAIRPAIRRGFLPILSDYESGSSNAGDDGDSESDGEKESQTGSTEAKPKLEESASGSSSDSDGQSEKCPICLVKFVSQEVGTPESCDHFFCAGCIQEWSKNVNTCPVDRQPYKLILIREHLEGKVIRQVPVQESSVLVVADDPTQEEDSTSCEICNLSDREETLLLCDGCDLGYHMECLNPPLEYVPIEDWYCPTCASRTPRGRNRRRQQNESEQGDEEEEERDDDFVPLARFRLVPRTSQSERVRRNVRRNNNIGGQQDQAPQPTSTSRGRFSAPVRARATARATRRSTRRTQRTGVRIKRIVTDDGVVEVILKCKKKSRKKRGRKKKRNRLTVSSQRTAKGRLAARLGICKPKITRQTIPETINKQELSTAPINHQRHQAGIPTLDLFGRRDQLDYFSGPDSEDDVGSMEGGVGILSRQRVARRSDLLLSRKKAASILSSTSQRKPLKIEKLPTPAGSSLLDSILDSQTLWHSKKTEIKSSSDGTLKVIPKSDPLKEGTKVDVKKTTAPVKETPVFPGGRTNPGPYRPQVSNQGGVSQGGSQSYAERSDESSYQSSAPSSSGFSRSEGSGGPGPLPLRGAAPIRFRMNIPPKRPNIHSYPSDNIPPPPPLRLRSPMTEMSFPANNSPEPSPEREEEDVDIYSDIEQESNTAQEPEERTFGALEPPPEPPFLMTMEPPPEPPALLMNLNDDASDDEPSGLIIDDPPPSEVYDPCAANSDDSSTGDATLSKPPELPAALKNPELVANYSSDSCPTQGSGSYNPELPTYSSTPIIGPLPRPASHNSSEAEDNDEECPNFSLYSAASMKLARRGIDLDIPIPPPIDESKEDSMDIPLPTEDFKAPVEKQDDEDIPLPPTQIKSSSPDHKSPRTITSPQIEESRDSDKDSNSGDGIKEAVPDDGDTEERSGDDEEEVEVDVKDEDEDDEKARNKDKKNEIKHEDKSGSKSEGESIHEDSETTIKSKASKSKEDAGEDECSTQGDVLDLAIETEANLENNLPHDDSEEQNEICLAKSPARLEESDDKIGDGGDKSDGLVDITDEEMSVYDSHDNIELEKLSEQIRESIQKEKQLAKSIDSDDDNSLVGGATSAVSAASLNDSDNVQTSTLPGLEGLETETISESEDVNFDELPSENHEAVADDEEFSSSRKKKKKKSRKISQNEDTSTKGNIEPLEFEEGEIIEDKPKKEKRSKTKPEIELEVDENIEAKKPKQPVVEKEKDTSDKKTKKRKDKSSGNKEKPDKFKEKEPKEKTLKPGEPDENISWKKLSKSTKERNYRDGKEKDDREKEKDKDRNRDRENKDESSKKKNREKRKELERYDVRRLISEKPKRPKKDEFGRDISPSSSSLSPYRPPRYRSPLRTRNRSRTRSKSWRSRSRSRGRRRRSRSRDRVRSRDRSKRSRTRDRSRKRSRSKNRVPSRSRDRRRSPERTDRVRAGQRSLSRGRRKTRSRSHHSHHSKKHRSSYSKSWTPSWSRSSMSRSHSPRHRRRSKSITRSRSRSWSRDKVPSMRGVRTKEPPKNLTVIVPNKEALKKKEKKKTSKKKDDRRKKKRGQSPAPSKEVFTSGDNILVSVNFKNANKNPEVIPATTPLLRESSKRKRDDAGDGSSKKKKSNSSKKTPGKKSNRLAKINEAAKNAKPVAIIDLDVSPFRAQTPSPKEVIVLSDSGDEGNKEHHSEMQDEISRMGHSGINQSMLSLSSIDHGQKNSVSQPESPVSSFMHNSSGPKTPPEPHIKFSISTKQSQMRMLSNPLMETEEEMQDDNLENEVNEIMHKGPNTPPEPPPEMTTPASPPTTPYDPFDPTKSRSPSPQPRSETGSQLNSSREDKSENVQSTVDDHPSLNEPRTQTPSNETEETKKTPEPPKVHSTPKNDTTTEISPKVSPSSGATEPKLTEDTLMQPIKKLLADANKLNVTVHKSPEKLITVVISQQTKNQNQTPKQPVLPLKTITPNKQVTPKTNIKHQLFSTNLVKQVPILGTLLPGPPVYVPSTGLNNSKLSNRSQPNGDTFEDMDIDPSSPYSPGSSEGDDLFEPPIASPPRSSSKPSANKSKPASATKFDSLFGSSPAKNRHGRYSSKSAKKSAKPKSKGSKKEEVKVKLDEDQLKILDDLPSSAVEMQFLKKLNRQERVVEEVKLVLKPHYAKKHINKEEYKEILRRSVPKICHNKSGEINPIKIQHLIEAYVKKFRYAKKKAAGAIPAPAAQNKPKPQKTLWS